MKHEDYVSFEQAKALKELGFDWKCETFYHLDNWCGLSHSGMSENHNMFEKCISAPTLSQAQKWLREVKGIALNIIAHDGGQFHWESIFLPEGPEFDDFIGPDNSLFPTYELALSAGIDEALAFLKEQNNGK